MKLQLFLADEDFLKQNAQALRTHIVGTFIIDQLTIWKTGYHQLLKHKFCIYS